MSLPPEFQSYFNYCRSLEFDQQPDYKFLMNLFLDLLGQRGNSMASLQIFAVHMVKILSLDVS